MKNSIWFTSWSPYTPTLHIFYSDLRWL